MILLLKYTVHGLTLTRHYFSVGLILYIFLSSTNGNKLRDVQGDAASHSPVGRNVCGERNRRYCCTGWEQPPGSRTCSRPVCAGGCEGGRCVRPNTCECRDGTIAPACTGDGSVSVSSQCNTRCLNGGQCAGTRCSCTTGYQGPNCGQPVCRSGCLNGGRCVSPNTCICIVGFTGGSCATDKRTGPCFAQVTDAMCRGQLTGVVCTKTLCCATIGQAWGNPCEQCPDQPSPCRRGYILNVQDNQCQDVDECQAIPGLCVGGQCMNTLGSYRCECQQGQVRNEVTNVCQDINECESIPNTCRNGQCNDIEGGFFCICYEGYEPRADRKACLPAKLGSCFQDISDGLTCVNPYRERFTWMDCCCKQNGDGWTQFRDCRLCPSIGTPSHRQLCINNEFKEDICNAMERLCENGRCVLTRDSYRCICDAGYVLDRNGYCVDINECEEQPCVNGQCTNTEGSFTCECMPGYEMGPDRSTCFEVNECETEGMCPNGKCVNVEGSYKCVCNKGFKQSNNQQICIDIDECHENGRVCIHGSCENYPGGYMCRCDRGYILSPDSAFCVDKDECQTTGMCTNGRCINTDGDYECLCEFGFELGPSGEVCIDINECIRFGDKCQRGQCINNQGSYRCECLRNYVLSPDGNTCIDRRKGLCFSVVRQGECYNPGEISITKSTCCCSMFASHAESVGWGGNCEICPRLGTTQYELLCVHPPGEDENGDINECVNNPNICGDHGSCENMVRDYRCICDPGYHQHQTRRICVDIDECRNGQPCTRGICRNTPGSFQCICPEGYSYDERRQSCEDIDECLRHPCQDAECTNTLGSFRCECTVPGYTLDSSELACLDIRQGACWSSITNGECEREISMKISKAECCGTIGKAWGSPCEPCPDQLPCPRGYYQGRALQCVDVDECTVFSNLCSGGYCTNTQGSFRCECRGGLSLDATGRKCIDLREDECFARYYRGQCLAPLMGLHLKSTCCCSIGAAWGSGCDPCPSSESDEYGQLCKGTNGGPYIPNINECMEFPNICQNGRCSDTMGSFLCVCNPGFAINTYGTNCTDINECLISQNPCGNGTCVNLPGRFKCDCFEGFESTMMMMCMDIDECGRDATLCRGGSCMNTIGSFYCDCPTGHELMPGGHACQDVNECSQESGICSNGRCENFMGGFECICDPGYESNHLKTTCVDINECANRQGGCMTLCINSPGSYSCGCDPGYFLLPDGKSCQNVDDCKENGDICGGGECTDTPGGYTCYCGDGLMIAPDRTTCLDIDECGLNRNLCLQGRCVNTVGSYICECSPGYSVKPESGNVGCTDDIECDVGTDVCSIYALCLNAPGSYTCQCEDGYRGGGRDCQDINECVHDNGGCHLDATCINLDGSMRCVCDEGFDGDGYNCRDIDECSLNLDLCENGRCFNFPGGYRCDCDMGFTTRENNRMCVDINECDMFRNLCVNGYCENTFGHYRCLCNQGYRPDQSGGNCTDIDECLNPDNCQYGICINSPGGYECECPRFYELNPTGTGCIDSREGLCYLDAPQYGRGRCDMDLGRYVTQATCCCSVGRGWGEQTGYCEACPRNNSREYHELCPGGTGFRPNFETVILEDIDECVDLPNLCRGGECRDSFGSFTCVCPIGYKLDETSMNCVDVNECAQGIAVCGIGTCINTEGNYTCTCPDGFMLMHDRNCMDVRPGNCYLTVFQADRRPSRLVCENPTSVQITKKQCCCSVGYGWNYRNEPCEHCPRSDTPEHNTLCAGPGIVVDDNGGPQDIDECALMPLLCSNGLCVNTLGSFHCQCTEGYRYEPTLHICQDIDECVEPRPPCLGSARCNNNRGSFECSCPLGYKLASNKRNCVDLDECIEQDVCDNGDCLNLVGSFQCKCLRGYKLSSDRRNCLDVDECFEQPGICRNGTCTNTQGSHTCDCYDGFRLTDRGDCEDIDECAQDRGLCYRGRCRNIQGSFICECQLGYQLSRDGRSCEDIDECRRNPCIDGYCHNTEGAYVCECNRGFELSANRDTCEDVNECAIPAYCHNGDCINTPGSFECHCPHGFIIAPSGRDCRDIRNATCFNSFREGQCTDPRIDRYGYPIKITRALCCCSEAAAWGENPCEICPISGDAGFSGLCPDGYGLMPGPDGSMDINECVVNPNRCENGICVNTDRSFRCECRVGFTLDSTGLRCIDADECGDAYNICGQGVCTNAIGGFECACYDGYSPGRDNRCEDIDECFEGAHQCAFRCENTEGSFRCACPPGYTLSNDGTHCQDVDECQTGANSCRYMCKNIVGSFLCICPEGFNKVGTRDECVDVDECRTYPCDNGRCRNTDGSYTCDCFSGYVPTQDRQSCVDIREGYCFTSLVGGRCLMHSTHIGRSTKGRCCCGLAAAWGQRCEACPRVGTVEFNRLCTFGPGFTPDGEDIDECSTMPDACNNGRCLNTMGSYRCTCNDGFKTEMSGSACIDIDECAHEPRPCEFTCQNTDGSYLCSCPQGYVVNVDGRTCRDLDECATMRHNCPHTCINTPGAFQCGCAVGYRPGARQGECIEIDECTEAPGLCRPIGTCVNLAGSYRCTCPRGYKVDESGTHCVDLNECGDDLMCEYGCKNMMGGYQCECPEGFTLVGQFAQCVDANECQQPGICGSGSCINKVGTFDCGCPNGRMFDSLNMMCITLGGGGCGAQPCMFGCTPTRVGFACGCPAGYQSMGQGHCIQTVSPPGASLPPGIELPHVAAPDGSDGVPQGEGCYSCNVNSEGIPLARPLGGRPRYLRVRRSVGNELETHEVKDGSLIFDVSGPHATPPIANSSTDNTMQAHLEHATIVHVAQVLKTVHIQTGEKPRISEKASISSDVGSESLADMKTAQVVDKNLTKTMDLRPDRPVVLYIWREQTARNEPVMRLIPSLTILENNEVCEITHGDHQGVFTMEGKEGINSLRFTKKLHHRRSFELKLSCRLLKTVDDVTLEPFVIHLQLNIL